MSPEGAAEAFPVDGRADADQGRGADAAGGAGRDLSSEQLCEQLHAARQSLLNNGPRSFLGKEARKESPCSSGKSSVGVRHPRDAARNPCAKERCLMESERIMRKWAVRRHWTPATKEASSSTPSSTSWVWRRLSLFDRYLAKTAAEEDDMTRKGRTHRLGRQPPARAGAFFPHPYS